MRVRRYVKKKSRRDSLMKKKTWSLTIVDNPNKVVSNANENDIFYVTDTEAYLVFKLLDEREGFNPHSAELTLTNLSNGSLAIYKDISVDNKEIKWEVTEEVISINGLWKMQLIYENEEQNGVEYYTTPQLDFPISDHLKKGRKEAIFAIESLDDIINSTSSLVDEWKTYMIDFQERVNAGEFNGADGTVEFEELTEEQVESLRGNTGRNLEFNWDGTRLGIKTEDEQHYDYTNLKGDKGDSIQFNWDGVRLGVKTEAQDNYEYSNLKGDKGDAGSIDNLDATDIEDALGFIPISADDIPEGLTLGEGPIEEGWLFKPVIIVDERNE